MSKYTFRIITLFGFIVILLGLIVPAWRLNVKMGDLKPVIESRIFGTFDMSKLSGNFEKFDTKMIPSIRTTAITLLSSAALSELILFASGALRPEHRRPANIVVVFFSVITLLAAIGFFVLNIIFVKQNVITQANGFTLKPDLKNGIYFMLMGGFANGLFSIYAVTYQK